MKTARRHAALPVKPTGSDPVPTALPITRHFDRLKSANMQAAALRKLARMRYPRYESDPAEQGLLVQIHEDGRRVRGIWNLKTDRFVPGRKP